jgi:MFS family permease
MATATAAVFANFLSTFGLVPLYPEVAHDLGLRADAFGAFFLIQGGLNVLLQLPVGVVADRIGRRPVMILGLAFMAASQVLRWLSVSPPIFALSTVFIGLCGPFMVTAAYSVVADAYRNAGRAQAIGIVQSATNVGQGAGFLLAGLLAPWLGWRTFSLLLGVLPVALLVFVLRIPEPARSERRVSLRTGIAEAGRFMLDPDAARIALVAGLNMGGALGASFLLPFTARGGGLAATATSLLLLPMLLGSTLGGPIAGRWADRTGPRAPGLVCAAIAAVAFGLLGVLPFSLPAVVILYLAIGSASSALLAVTSVAIADMANRRGEGTGVALGGVRVGQALGPTLAPVLVGSLYVHAGKLPAFALLAIALGIAGWLVLLSVSTAIPDRAVHGEVPAVSGAEPLA